MNNAVPDVRKTVVFCLVEVGEAMGLQLFSQEVMEKHLNISQQRLVQIYIERKQFSGGNQARWAANYEKTSWPYLNSSKQGAQECIDRCATDIWQQNFWYKQLRRSNEF